MPAEREVFRSVVEYVMSLQKIYDKGGKEICFQRLSETLSSDIFDGWKKNPVEAYFKPAFSALGCSNIYSEYLNWGLAKIISEKSQESGENQEE